MTGLSFFHLIRYNKQEEVKRGKIMTQLGISLYPHLQAKQDMEIQLRLAKKIGYSDVYTSIQSDLAWASTSQLTEPFLWLIDTCRVMSLQLHVDINRSILERLQATAEDLSPFRRRGISIIRLDFGFEDDHEEVAVMTKNDENIWIEDNCSMQRDPIARVKAMQHHGNLAQYLVFHNFFPRTDTGLSFRRTIELAKLYHACGIRTGVFINSLASTSRLFKYSHGLCTVENHRYKPSYLSAGELIAPNQFDYLFFGDGDPSENEMLLVQEIGRNRRVILPVYFNSEISVELKQTLLDMTFLSRSDQPEFIVRATQSRGCAKIEPFNCMQRDKLCITLDNSLAGKYEGELQIAMKDLPSTEYTNVIGQVDMLAENLIYLIQCGKVSFRMIEADKLPQ